MGTITLSAKERKRLELFGKVKRGSLRLAKAAQLLQLSYRQVKRSFRRYARAGAAGLAHRLRGRRSNRRSSATRRAAILRRYRERYADFGPTLAAEYLVRDRLAVSVQTLRRWLIAEGLWEVRRHTSQHRRWREPKEYLGEMVQMDGSHHDWFEGRRDGAVLMVMIDDATHRVYARFFEEETTEAAMTTLYHYVRLYGLPRSLYVDRDSIYRVNREAATDEALRGDMPMSQFGRAMKELDVKLICAHSPQAKGRVERCNGTLQDRLVKALRLEKITTLEQANRYLEKRFLAEFNERFRCPAAKPGDLHRRVPRGVDLDLVLSNQEERVVRNDWTVSWRNRWFQLSESHRKLALVKQRVLVCEQLDGTIRMRYCGRELVWIELASRPNREKLRGKERSTEKGKGQTKGPWKPPADHPWRRGL